MTIEGLQKICDELPGVVQDVKWGKDLVFSIAGKMFCVVGLDHSSTSASFKVPDEAFEETSSRPGFKPAPYVAKYKWVLIEDINKMNTADWKKNILESYTLVKEKLSAKARKQAGV